MVIRKAGGPTVRMPKTPTAPKGGQKTSAGGAQKSAKTQQVAKSPQGAQFQDTIDDDGPDYLLHQKTRQQKESLSSSANKATDQMGRLRRRGIDDDGTVDPDEGGKNKRTYEVEGEGGPSGPAKTREMPKVAVMSQQEVTSGFASRDAATKKTLGDAKVASKTGDGAPKTPAGSDSPAGDQAVDAKTGEIRIDQTELSALKSTDALAPKSSGQFDASALQSQDTGTFRVGQTGAFTVQTTGQFEFRRTEGGGETKAPAGEANIDSGPGLDQAAGSSSTASTGKTQTSTTTRSTTTTSTTTSTKANTTTPAYAPPAGEKAVVHDGAFQEAAAGLKKGEVGTSALEVAADLKTSGDASDIALGEAVEKAVSAQRESDVQDVLKVETDAAASSRGQVSQVPFSDVVSKLDDDDLGDVELSPEARKKAAQQGVPFVDPASRRGIDFPVQSAVTDMVAVLADNRMDASDISDNMEAMLSDDAEGEGEEEDEDEEDA